MSQDQLVWRKQRTGRKEQKKLNNTPRENSPKLSKTVRRRHEREHSVGAPDGVKSPGAKGTARGSPLCVHQPLSPSVLQQISLCLPPCTSLCLPPSVSLRVSTPVRRRLGNTSRFTMCEPGTGRSGASVCSFSRTPPRSTRRHKLEIGSCRAQCPQGGACKTTTEFKASFALPP